MLPPRLRAAAWHRLIPTTTSQMLAFDIETMGLDKRKHEITCACAYDAASGIKRSFVFQLGDSHEEFLQLLDQADALCAFNGFRFDVPFIVHRWNVPAVRYSAWIQKLFDPFEVCKTVLDRTFKLDRLLEANGLPVKTGSGLEAIKMAAEKRYTELVDYCMHDTVMTHAVCTLPSMVLPVATGTPGSRLRMQVRPAFRFVVEPTAAVA